MSRYLIQFYKQDMMRYISHLDLLRLFKRTFKRTGIRLIYSQGFNPHPKMSFVQPLSLGYSSCGEYLDFETMDRFTPEQIQSKLNEALPSGVGVTACRQLAQSKKTLAAIVEYAAYDISAELSSMEGQWREKLPEFLRQTEIIIEKKQKKTGKLVKQDIRPMIRELRALEHDDNYIMLTALIAAGSNCNLNPEILLSAFCQFCEIPFVAELLSITRNELYFVEAVTQNLKPMLEYEVLGDEKEAK